MFDPLILTEIVKVKQYNFPKAFSVSVVFYIFPNQNNSLEKLINLIKN